MIAWLRQRLARPVFEDEEKNRAATLAYRIAQAMLVLMFLTLLLVAFVAPGEEAITFAVAVPFMVVSIVMLRLINRGRLDVAGWLLIAMFYLTITWSVYSYRGVRDLTVTGYFVAVILAMLLLGGRGALIVSFVSGATVLAVYVAEVNGYVGTGLEATTPPFQLTTLLVMLAFAAALMRFAVKGNEYAFRQQRKTATALREANRELEHSRDALAGHATALERRSAYLQASSEVARAVVSILDVEELLSRVVELIRDRFDLYYVGIFMLDEDAAAYPSPGAGRVAGANAEWVKLRAGTGAAGKAMLARGHCLRVGEGMIGWSVAQGQVRVAREAQADQVRVSIPELPDTRAEAALPLKSRGRVLGAITVQDTREGAFDEEAVSVLGSLADQVAVALDNARLLRESQSALEAERRAYGEISARGWAEMVRQRRDRRGTLGYVYRPGGNMAPAQGPWSADMLRASKQGETVVGDGGTAASGSFDSDGSGTTVAVPIKIRDRVMGVVRLQKKENGPQSEHPSAWAPGAAWTEEELALLQTLTSQLEVALESARLYQDTQQRAARERMIGEVTARMRETLDLDAILQTATQEIRQALGLSQLTVQLVAEPDEPEIEGTG